MLQVRTDRKNCCSTPTSWRVPTTTWTSGPGPCRRTRTCWRTPSTCHGDEYYELRFRDLTTGAELDDVISRCAPLGTWSADSSTFFYVVHDDLWRQHQVWRHRLGTPVSSDVLVVEDPDGQFELDVTTSRTGDLVVISSENRNTSEVWVVDAHAPDSPARSVGGRRPRGRVPGRARAVRRRHRRAAPRDRRRRDGVPPRALPGAPPGRPGLDGLAAAASRGPGRAVAAGVDAFAGHVVLTSRADGRNRLRILALDDLTGDGIVVGPAFGDLVAGAVGGEERRGRRRLGHRGRRVLPPAAGLVVAVPGDGGADRAAPQGGAGLRHGGVRRRAALLPVGRRSRGAGNDPAAPRHPARRDRPRVSCTPTAPTRRSTRTRSGTRRSRRCSIAASSTCTRTCAAAARAAAGGGSTGGWSTSSTPSTTTSPSRTASPRPGSWTGRGSRPAACRRAGCSRARSSRSARTAGGPSWRRCRSSTC